MDMANYIYSILKNQLNIMWSWGLTNPYSLPNNKGLIFHVDGFLHHGFVTILYNGGKDLFNIFLLNNKMGIVKKIEGVYFDRLVDIIDAEVEKVEDYENRIRQEYSLL